MARLDKSPLILDIQEGSAPSNPEAGFVRIYSKSSDSKIYIRNSSGTETDLTGGAGGDTIPVGSIMPYAGTSAPTGWLLCHGSTELIASYADLFAVLSTTYGGNGTTTFGIPDIRGRVIAGKDDMGGSAASRLTTGSKAAINGLTLGASGGVEEHQLIEAEIPSFTKYNSHVTVNTTPSTGGNTRVTSISTTTFGGDANHTNTQPTIVLNYIIKT